MTGHWLDVGLMLTLSLRRFRTRTSQVQFLNLIENLSCSSPERSASPMLKHNGPWFNKAIVLNFLFRWPIVHRWISPASVNRCVLFCFACSSFRSDPDRWARYFRVQRMIAHLDRVERQAAEKRRFELQRQQSRTSNASSSTCLQPMSPGAMPAAASDQARSSLPISTASSKRSSSWRGRHSRRTSSPQSGGGLRVVVVEAQTDADNQQLPSQSLGDQQPATVASRDTIQAAVKSRASAVRLSSSRSACGRLDCCCDGNSSAADSSKDKAPVDRPPKRALSFTGATSLRTVTPPAETVTSVALPTLLEVHRTLSVSSQFVLTSSPISRDDSRTIASSDNGSGGGSTMHTSTVWTDRFIYCKTGEWYSIVCRENSSRHVTCLERQTFLYFNGMIFFYMLSFC